MINEYPGWKYAIVILVVIAGILYAIPNLYGKRPSVVVSPRLENIQITSAFIDEVKSILDQAKLKYTDIKPQSGRLVIYFDNSDQGFEDQRKAATALDEKYISTHVVSQALVPNSPQWLQMINANPVNMGLDLQGGVHALMDVDLDAAIEKSILRYQREIKDEFRSKNMRYRAVRIVKNGLKLWFKKEENRAKAEKFIRSNFSGFTISRSESSDYLYITAMLTEQEIDKEKSAAIEKNILTLRRRVNELGVTEPIITRQGKSRIAIQLPGIQNPEKLWEIINKEAAIEARGVSELPFNPELGQTPPIGTELYYDRNKRPFLLKKEPIWTGENVKDASAGFSSQPGDSSPAVHITLDSEGGKSNSKYTAAHVGKSIAILYIDNRPTYVERDGKKVRVKKRVAEIISVATIRGSLYKRFEISGLDSVNEAQVLAILLRSGSLAAPIVPAEVRTVGPTMGAANIHQGMNSVIIGFLLVLVFMLVYYRHFGLIANVALLINLVLLVALLSMLQATLTLPGIAGIVLTVGMAVDANVLIFERIREEIRLGNSPQASIHSGYEKAFSTITDANITTFIAALVLLGIGSGPIKGFAVTLSLGILTSMFSAIMITRAIVNLTYGGRKLSSLSI